MQKRLKIAVQKSGRLTEKSIELLSDCGFNFQLSSRKLISPAINEPLDLIYLRNKDIPKYILMNKCDLGIVGRNILDEYYDTEDIEVITSLPYGQCRISLAFPENKLPRSFEDINGKVIATSYPRILERELSKRGIEVKIINLSGSIEVGPILDICDGVFDIVSTGSTLKAHGLIEYSTLYESNVVLFQKKSLIDEFVQNSVSTLKLRIESSLKAKNSRYLMMNAPVSKIDEIVKLVPGMEAPSIIQLSTDATKVAIHGVIESKNMWKTIEKLKTSGASSILVTPIEKVLE
jgi:ATP phosphoribosyltransferase